MFRYLADATRRALKDTHTGLVVPESELPIYVDRSAVIKVSLQRVTHTDPIASRESYLSQNYFLWVW